MTCPDCDGTGRRQALEGSWVVPLDEPCRFCGGKGDVSTSHSTSHLDVSGPPVALNELCAGPSCRHPSHAVGAPDEMDALRAERDRLRERLDQFEAYGYPTLASVLDRVAELERAYEDDVVVLQHAVCAFAFDAGLNSAAKCVWCGYRAREDSEEMRAHLMECSVDPLVWRVQALEAALREIAAGKMQEDVAHSLGEWCSMAGRFVEIAKRALRDGP